MKLPSARMWPRRLSIYSPRVISSYTHPLLIWSLRADSRIRNRIRNPMRRTHLGVQIAIVLTMVSFVSWPQFRPVRAQSVWRYAPAAVLQARTLDAARYAGAGRPGMRLNEAAFKSAWRDSIGATDRGNAFYLSPAIAALGGKLNALLGFARTSLNVPIPYARVLLRNIITGQVIARGVANDQGMFSFLDLDTSSYIVELLGPDGSVIATSSIMSVARGDVRRTEIRAAAAATTVAASFGNALTGTLDTAANVASSNGVTKTTATLTTQESPR